MRFNLFLAAAAFTKSAHAAIIDLSLSGTIVGINDHNNHIGGAIALNDAFTATIQYDSDAPLGSTFTDSNGLVHSVYPFDATSPFMTINIGSEIYTGSTGVIYTNFDGILNETVFSSNNPSAPNFGMPAGGSIAIYLSGTTGAGGQLPGADDFAPPSGLDDQIDITMGTFPGDFYEISAQVASINGPVESATPEPDTIALLGAGLLGLGGAIRRYRVIR